MKQLTQQLKSGKMEIMDVPFPSLGENEILVRNHFSVISSGTEGKTVSDARKGYLAKAKSRQKEVKQVIDQIKINGLISTYNLVMNKLEAPSPLGYSSAGEVIAVGDRVTNFKVGEYAACGGSTAKHADVINVPVNLAVKVPSNVNLKHAAFSTIAAIAIQGIRQADLRLGENCLIIGMGLIGQLTYKILESSGINPIGIDISKKQINQAKKAGIQFVYERDMPGIEEKIQHSTNGHGVDSVIITAGTSSLDPVEFAGQVARHKAKVVIVGAVPTGFSRENYYRKELELLMSSSYGPGRYDSNYEEKGLDYPIGYVRWTENRNMQSYLNLLSTNRLDIDSLITHTFPLIQAPSAYDLILGTEEPFTGVVIKYDTDKELEKRVQNFNSPYPLDEVNVGFIGAGSFAQGMLLPKLKGLCNFTGIATRSGTTSKYVSDKYGFKYCSDNADEIIEDAETNTIFIVTRHDLHAKYVSESIKNNKHIFVEKPLVINEEELKSIEKLYLKSRKSENPIHLMVGFNRRFAPAVQKIKSITEPKSPKTVNIRVNAGHLPSTHWVHDPEVGGGKIVSEVCHFIDLAMYLTGGRIISVSADVMNDPDNLSDTLVINLKMDNGSVATVSYFSNGNTKIPKEYIEVFADGTIAQIDDFKSLRISGNKNKNKKYKNQDKGHQAEMDAFISAIKNNGPTPILFEELYNSTLATFKVLESISQNRKVFI